MGPILDGGGENSVRRAVLILLLYIIRIYRMLFDRLNMHRDGRNLSDSLDLSLGFGTVRKYQM